MLTAARSSNDWFSSRQWMKLPGETTLFLRSRGSVVLPDDREPIGIAVRQRLQQQRVDDAEDRGVRADAERQRGDGDEAEARRAQQQPRAVAKVLKQDVIEPRSVWLVGCSVLADCAVPAS